MIEYRITWRRESGSRRKSARFATRAGLERRLARMAEMAADPHLFCDHVGDPMTYCTPISPVVEGPIVQSRTVGPWEEIR